MINNKIDISGKNILVTGCAGFIGGGITLELVKETNASNIIGLDNMNSYYDVGLKEFRLLKIQKADNNSKFVFVKGDISDPMCIEEVFEKYEPVIVIHLAAQAGVRYSISNPEDYITSNIVGFYNMLEACRARMKRENKVEHFLYASSSSVYGNNKKIPYSIEDKTDYPVSFYAATKKADEVMAYAYAKLYGISMTGMRFFTVYGPAGRPDMAYYKFAEKIIHGENIELYNNGNNKRDFTYIDDVVNAVIAIMLSPPFDDHDVAYKIYNIGNGNPIDTITFVNVLVDCLKNAKVISNDFDVESSIKYMPKVAGDVEETYADISDLKSDFGMEPKVGIEEGLSIFSKWYADYMKCNSI